MIRIIMMGVLASGILYADVVAQSAMKFEEIAEKAGVQFVHSTRKFGDRHKAEVLQMFTDGGAAVAVGDYNADGFDDLFVVDSGPKYQPL